MEIKNIFFYLRFILCISLIGIWVLWLANLSMDKKNIDTENKKSLRLNSFHEKVEKKETQNVRAIPAKGEARPPRARLGQRRHELPQNEKKIIRAKNEVINLPKLEDLIPINELSQSVNIMQKVEDKINPNKITSFKREVLLTNPTSSKLTLRKKIYVDKNQHRPILKKLIEARKNNEIDTKTIESWLPD